MPDADHGHVTLADLDGRDFGEVWEVAAVLDADLRTIRSRCRDGKIPSVKVGSRYKIPLAWLRQAASAGVAS